MLTTMAIGSASVLARALLQAAVLGATPAAQSPAQDSVTICLIDAATHAPVIGVELRIGQASVSESDKKSRATPVVVRTRSACVTIPAGALSARRVGYRELHRQLSPTIGNAPSRLNEQRDAIVVALTPVAVGIAPMDTVRVNADATGADASPTGRMSATVSASSARERGASSTDQLISLLPLAQVRSARGETGVSLRGSRREQVVMTLDGLPLNDPATGTADVSDLPLASLGSATVNLGADPLNAGPGAGGGVIALTTAAQRVLALRAGSFGQASVEGAWAGQVNGALLHGSALLRAADNDFPFENTAGASGLSQREHRVNNDEARTSINAGAIANAWQVALMASRTDRGMVGAANVHAYDADRSRTDRLLLRAQLTAHGTQLLVGAREFELGYHDPTRPSLDYEAKVHAVDAEWRGQHSVMPARAMLVWRVGGGADAVHATGNLDQDRRRAFAMSQAVWNRQSWRADFGVRVDAIEGGGAQPSLSLAAERDIGKGWSLSARAAQAVRAPTLYDLYFTSPQRVSITALRPEHITADAEIASHWAGATPLGRAAFDLSIIARRTSDAIVWFPGNFMWSPANVGREALHGGEARLRVNPSWGEWSLWSTLYDPLLLTGGLRIPTPYVARVSGGSQWLVQHRGMSFSMITRSMGRRPYTAGPRDPLYELSAVTLVDLAVTHGLPRILATPHIDSRITWSVENATDAAWQSVRGFPSPGRTWALAIVLRPLKRS